jgi:hypothetical protein
MKIAAEALRSGAPPQPVPLPEPPPGPEPVPPPTPRPEPVPGAPDKNGSSRGQRSPGGLEPPWDEDPPEASIRFGSQDRRGLLSYGQRRKRRQPGVGAAAGPTRTRTGRRREGRVARLPPSARGGAMIVVIADEAHRNLSSSSCAVPPVVRIGHRRRLRAGADNSGNVMAGRPRVLSLRASRVGSATLSSFCAVILAALLTAYNRSARLRAATSSAQSMPSIMKRRAGCIAVMGLRHLE